MLSYEHEYNIKKSREEGSDGKNNLFLNNRYL